MPKEKMDPEDPLEMIGVELPAQSENELREMALAFAEEFARDGWDREKLFAMFRNPFYQGPHLVWKQKGDDFVRGVIEDAIAMWRPTHNSFPPCPPEADPPSCWVDGGRQGWGVKENVSPPPMSSPARGEDNSLKA